MDLSKGADVTMCITRVGRVLGKRGSKATVRFLDDDMIREVDISMLDEARKNSYVEIFADRAINLLSTKEAQWRKKLWIELRERTGRVSL